VETDTLVGQLRKALGAGQVVTAAHDMAPFLTDWRHRYTGTAEAVVFPATAQQASLAIRACAQHGAAVVPQGGNTGLSGGATPEAGRRSIVVSTRRLCAIRALDLANDTVTVEAGCTLQALRDAAQSAGRLFPLSLAAQGSCTIGGNLATNAGGTQVLQFGNARDLTLGLEVVLADGSIWNGLRGLRKDNSGYDLKHLFIGSEGTLGLITAATLKLFALPRARLTAMACVAGIDDAIALLHRLRSIAGPTLTAFELMSGECLQAVSSMPAPVRLPFDPPGAWNVLVEVSDYESEAHAGALIETGLDRDAGAPVQQVVLARSLADSDRLWRVREAIPEAQARSGGNVKHDISLPLDAMAAFVQQTGQQLRDEYEWVQPVVFGVAAQQAFDHEAGINRIVYDAVQRHGGSFSAEHGLGQLKRAAAVKYKSALELELMRSVKNALDPSGRMNPGKML
jgi:FAD/FMN-containing dehydrogenase